jgi:hypothetical protein
MEIPPNTRRGETEFYRLRAPVEGYHAYSIVIVVRS